MRNPNESYEFRNLQKPIEVARVYKSKETQSSITSHGLHETPVGRYESLKQCKPAAEDESNLE